MIRAIQIPMVRRSGKTTTAAALVSGFRSNGLRAFLIVPRQLDKIHASQYINTDFVINVTEWQRTQADVFVVDDAERCRDQWMNLGEGDLVASMLSRFKTYDDNAARVFLFTDSLI